MFVKGSAFHARRSFWIKELGEERWNEFFAGYVAGNHAFARPILVTTDIDVMDFARLNDAVIARFYGGDPKTYFRFGEESAEWALRDGPYRHLAASKDYKAYISRHAVYFRIYFSAGQATASLEGDTVDFRIEVPDGYRHVYLEYNPVGYLRRGIEITGPEVLATDCVRGFSRGDADVHYRLRLGSGPRPGRPR